MDFDLLRTGMLATFASQLVTMSIITPRRIYLCRRELWEKYPLEQYPGLYPIGTARLKRQQSIANVVNGVVFCFGVLLFIALLIRPTATHQIAFVTVWMGVVQIAVPLPRWILDRQIIRAYKSTQPPAVRSAAFKSWTLWDFVSPAFVVCGIASTTVGLSVAVLVALSQQERTALTPARLIFMSMAIMSMDLLLLFRMIRAVLQPLLPRIDPYATAEDLYATRKRRLRSLFIGSAIFSVVTTIELLTSSRFLDIRYEYIAIGLSVLLQATSLMISTMFAHQLRTRDFSAYREKATVAPQSLA